MKCAFSFIHNLDVSHTSKLCSLQDIKIKQLEEQIQELENSLSSVRQQLKEAEENHATEINCLHQRFQTVKEVTVQPRYLCKIYPAVFITKKQLKSAYFGHNQKCSRNALGTLLYSQIESRALICKICAPIIWTFCQLP